MSAHHPSDHSRLDRFCGSAVPRATGSAGVTGRSTPTKGPQWVCKEKRQHATGSHHQARLRRDSARSGSTGIPAEQHHQGGLQALAPSNIFSAQYRMFFRFHVASKIIVLAWANDENTKFICQPGGDQVPQEQLPYCPSRQCAEKCGLHYWHALPHWCPSWHPSQSSR